MMIIKSETPIEIPYEDGLVAKINIIDSPRGKLLGIIEGTSPYYLIKAIYNNTKIKSFMHLKYLENIKKGENKPLPEELFSVLNASPIHKEIILASGRELYPILKSEVIIGDDCSSRRILSLADCLANIGNQVQKSFGPNEHIQKNINYGLEILHMNNNFAGEKPYYNSVFGKIYELQEILPFMKNLSKSEAEKKVADFFLDIKNKNSKQIKKIKSLAMNKKISLKEYRKLFCRKCLTSYSKNEKIRIKKGMKSVECLKCKKINRWKIK